MSATTTTVPFESEQPLDRNIVHRCCSLTISGNRCKQSAVRGQNYCTTHLNRNPRVFEEPGHIIIPLLEDHAAVQLTATKILSGLANGTIKPDVANAMNHTLSTVVRTLPRPAPLKPGHSEPRQQPALFTVDDNGAWVAPPEPWLDDSGNITTYDQLAWTANKPEPTDPATAVTNSYQQLITDLIRQKIRREKAESTAALTAGLADPHPENAHYRSNGKCAFGIPFCDGPCDPEPCMFCRGDLHLQPTTPQYPGDNVLALVTALRTHIKEQQGNEKQKQNQEQNPNQKQNQNQEEKTGAPYLPDVGRCGRPMAQPCPRIANVDIPENPSVLDQPAPEPLVLDLKATADTPRAPRCRPDRPTRNTDRQTGSKRRAASYRPPPAPPPVLMLSS